MPTLRYLRRSLTLAAIVAELDQVDRAALTPGRSCQLRHLPQALRFASVKDFGLRL